MKNILLLALACACLASGQKPVTIFDPILNMNAYAVTRPSGWSFEGMVMQGTSCAHVPAPVFRAVSPDGVTEVKQLPRSDWTWMKSGPSLNGPDCLPLSRPMSASEYLKYFAGILQVEFVREEPVTPEELAKLRQDSPKPNPAFVSKLDTARIIVRYTVNNIPVEERLQADTLCSVSSYGFAPNVIHQYSCSAYVERFRARQGNLEASAGLFKTITDSFRMNPQWGQLFQTNMLNRTRAQGQAALAAQRASMEQAAAIHNRMHNEIMASIERGADRRQAQFQQRMDDKSRVADDWRDYALDLQKRQSPTTGQVIKTSSQYSYTWVNEQGRVYNTNDPNYNPNGRGTGNWTLQQNVR